MWAVPIAVQALVVREIRPEPLKIEEWQAVLDKKKLGPKFRRDAKAVENTVEALSQNDLETLAALLEKEEEITLSAAGLSEGKSEVKLGKDLISIGRHVRVEHTRDYYTKCYRTVILGSILYSLLGQIYWHRADDVARGISLQLKQSKIILLEALPPLLLAPHLIPKVLFGNFIPFTSISRSCVLMIIRFGQANLFRSFLFLFRSHRRKFCLCHYLPQTEFVPIIRKVSQRLRSLGISNRIDDTSASIGKRYSRNDELNTPLGITVDFDSVKDGSITLRDRDSTKQVRASQDEIIAAIKSLVEGQETWEEVFKRFPEFLGQSTD